MKQFLVAPVSSVNQIGIACVLLGSALLGYGCQTQPVPLAMETVARAAEPAQNPTPTPVPSPTPLPTSEALRYGVNEAGRIPVLMYHSVGDPGPYDRNGLNISPATFRKHLHMLYGNGFYPVNMRDALSPRLEVPVGRIPVVITFDDARGSQFRYLKDGRIDPDCAVGILDSFHRRFGKSWPQRAVFYVLPRSKYNPTPFWQQGMEKKKLQYLVAAGYELANHSTSHRPMSRLSARELEWEMKTCKSYIQKLAPGATMDTVALPYGIYPREQFRDVLLKENRCILMAWGDASYSPVDKRYDNKAIQRIGSTPGNIERWIRMLTRDKRAYSKALRPFISDGDPDTVTVPDSQLKFVDKTRLDGAALVTYSEPSAERKKPVSGKAVTKDRRDAR